MQATCACLLGGTKSALEYADRIYLRNCQLSRQSHPPGEVSKGCERVEEMALADKWTDRRERVRAAKVLPDTIEDAFASPEEIAETKRKLAEAGVKYVLSCWIDLLGQPKTKPVPLGELA